MEHTFLWDFVSSLPWWAWLLVLFAVLSHRFWRHFARSFPKFSLGVAAIVAMWMWHT